MRIVLALIAFAMLAGPAAAKSESEAWLKSSIPLNAASGATVRVAWQVLDREGGAFNASGMFVRFVGRAGTATEGFASQGAHPTGDYLADVAVPEGGIARIEFGLAGTVTGPSIRAHRSDMIFPLMNAVWTATAIEPGPFRQVSAAGAPAMSPAPTAVTSSTRSAPSADLRLIPLLIGTLAGLALLLAVRERMRRVPSSGS